MRIEMTNNNVVDSERKKPIEMEVKVVKNPVKEKQSKVEIGVPKTQNEQNSLENEQVVIKAIEKANKHIKTFDRRLEFSIHESTKQIMVKVIDTEDNTVIREIPSEKVLDMVAHMWEVAGILVDEKV